MSFISKSNSALKNLLILIKSQTKISWLLFMAHGVVLQLFVIDRMAI